MRDTDSVMARAAVLATKYFEPGLHRIDIVAECYTDALLAVMVYSACRHFGGEAGGSNFGSGLLTLAKYDGDVDALKREFLQDELADLETVN